MTTQDPISSLLTTIRNGQLSHKLFVVHYKSKSLVRILNVLIKEGFIVGYSTVTSKDLILLKIFLKYHENGAPLINQIIRVSKPGQRIYFKISDLKEFKNSLGIYILSTTKGIISDIEARRVNIGGEVLCKIF
jgi:small subunit ribosomal protein S8